MTNSGWKLKRITPPSVEPVTLGQAKAHLRVVIADDDALITGLIQAARESAEQYTRRAFVSQEWEAGYDTFPCDGEFELAKPPLIRVVDVRYTDTNGAEQVLPDTDYVVDTYSEPARLLRAQAASWPVLTEPGINVRVRFVAGFAVDTGSPSDDAVNVPMPIKQAILLHVGEMYENRESAAAMPAVCEALLHPYRVYGWGDR